MSAPNTAQRLVHVLMRALQTALRLRRPGRTAPAARDEADQALQLAFGPVWDWIPYLELTVGPDAIRFEGYPVLSSEEDRAGLVDSLASAGVRSLRLLPGVELEEIKLVLTAIAASQERSDRDLLSSLFRADLDHLQYEVAHEGSDAAAAQAGPAPGGAPASRIAAARPEPAASPDLVREAVRRDVADSVRSTGVVRLEQFDSTLYFLDEREIEYLRSAIDREYAQDLALNVLSLLLDVLELRNDPAVRSEVVEILAHLLPDLLGAGRFSAVAYLVGGVREAARNAQGLTEAQKEALDALRESISHPRAVSQLFLALEGGAVAPTPESMGTLLRELRPTAVRQVLAWGDRLSDPATRSAVVDALDAFFTEWPHGLARMVNAPERDVVVAGLGLAGRLKRPEFVDIVGEVARHEDPLVRRAVAEALAAISTAASFRRLTGMAEDTDRDVRIVVYRTFASRPFRPAFTTLQRAVTGNDLEERGQREKRALFEAFGGLAGAEGIGVLEPLLKGRSPSGQKPSSHTRACAAIALGLIGTPGARAALERAVGDRDPLVRSAVGAALRGEG